MPCFIVDEWVTDYHDEIWMSKNDEKKLHFNILELNILLYIYNSLEYG